MVQDDSSEGNVKDQASNRLKLCISLFCHALRSQVSYALQLVQSQGYVCSLHWHHVTFMTYRPRLSQRECAPKVHIQPFPV